MKTFFTKKRIAFAAILAATFVTLIILLIVPIGSAGNGFWIYNTFTDEFEHCSGAPVQEYWLTSPFTLSEAPYQAILIEQTLVFTLVGIVFVIFLALFLVELKKAGVFNRTHRPTKTERLQAQIDELQKQVDELKKED